jgi:dTDP-4-dehydrorhamnose reductase
MRVVILGSNGLVGSSLVPYLKTCGHDVLTHTRGDSGDLRGDLTSADAVGNVLSGVAPDVIVNLAALTDVDECELSPQTAYLTNVRIVENIATWISANGSASHLIQVSTDQVYGGRGPHKEHDVMLSNYYGFSKYAGELAAARVASTVLRTNFIGPSQCRGKPSLSDWLVQSLVKGDAITVFDDVRFSPLSLTRLVEMIELAGRARQPGVFNLGSSDGISKADLAFALAKVLGLSEKQMTRGSSNARPLTANRPKDMSMDSSRFEQLFGVRLPTVREVIKSMREAYKHEAR